MKIEHELMNLLRRTVALSRRLRKEKRENTDAKHVRGMGHILDVLSETEGKSQRLLAKEVGVRPQSLTQALLMLENRGEIKREISSLDRRVTLVFLTEEGRKRRDERREERLLHAEQFFSVLDEKEKEAFLVLLKKITASYEAKEES